MIKLNFIGRATVRIGSFGKFVPGSSTEVSEEDAKTLLGTKLFKSAIISKLPKALDTKSLETKSPKNEGAKK